MTKTEQFKRVLWYVFAAVLSLTILSTYLLSGLMAKYVTGASASDEARVATFNVSQTNTLEAENITLTLTPESAAYPIEIDASSDGETSVRCNVEITKEGNLPIVFESGTVNPMTMDGTDTKWYYDIDPAGGEKKLTINALWDSTKQGYSYSGGVEMLYITVSLDQID